MAITRNPVLRLFVVGLSLVLLSRFAFSQDQTPASPAVVTQPPAAQNSSAASGVDSIRGIVKASNVPIPGAAVSIALDSSSPISTWTDVDGNYSATIPAYGTYTVRVQMVAFANSSQKVVVDASHSNVQVNFELTLLSRARESAPQPRRPPGQMASPTWISESLDSANTTGQDTTGAPSNDVVPSGMPVPGIDPNSATESISISGNASNSFSGMSGDELQQRINDARMQGGGFGSGPGGGQFGGPSHGSQKVLCRSFARSTRI